MTSLNIENVFEDNICVISIIKMNAIVRSQPILSLVLLFDYDHNDRSRNIVSKNKIDLTINCQLAFCGQND